MVNRLLNWAENSTQDDRGPFAEQNAAAEGSNASRLGQQQPQRRRGAPRKGNTFNLVKLRERVKRL